jgi:hypothetical protein
MSAILKSIDDPRDALDRAKRPALVAFARANGMKHITEQMPAILIRRELRQNNLTHIPQPPSRLGQPPGGAGGKAFVPAPDGAAAVDAEADLARQFAQYQQADPAVPAPVLAKPLAEMNINELGAEMKRLQIKRVRTDNMESMRVKIAAHRAG